MNEQIDWSKAPEGAEAGYLGTSHAYDAWYKREENGEVLQICPAAGFNDWVSMGGRKDFPVGSVLRPTMTDHPEYTGGSVSYYTCSVTHPISETADPYDAECIDIIDALQMTPSEANAFKALWRRAAARLGKSKRGYTDGLYDAEKVEFYGKRLVEMERRARPVEACYICQRPVHTGSDCAVESPRFHEALNPDNQRVHVVYSHSVPRPEGEGWCAKNMAQPRDLKQRIEYVSVTGNVKIGYGHEFSWDDAAWWRYAQPTDPFGPRDADGWYTWNGDDTMRPAGRVDVVRRDGEFIGNRSSENEVRWSFTKEADHFDVVKWRPAKR